MSRSRESETVAGSRDTFASNRRLLAETQPWCRLPDDDGSVGVHDGVWHVEGPEGAVQLHGRDPMREASRLVADALAERPDAEWLVVVGLGLGYVLDALERREWRGRVLAIEPGVQSVPHWLGRRDWRVWLETGRLRLLTGPDYHGVSECRLLAGDGTAEPAWLVSPVLSRTHPDAPARAAAIVERLRFDARANAQARRQHGARYLLNTLRNVSVLQHAADARRLAGLLPGVPAIVAGAGPSLDRVLPALRDARRRAVIIAVDTALRPLLAAGIEPHLVVAVDPGEANVRHLVDLPPLRHAHLVAEGSVDRQAWESFEGRSFAFNVSDHHPWPWLRSIGLAPARLRAWGSVLTTAFDLACSVGADPIVFVGSDLAFTDMRPYARGVSYEDDWRRLAEWGVPLGEQWAQQVAAWPPVETHDLDGRPARTAAHLVAFRNWLVDQAGRLPGRHVVNATDGGILQGSGIQRQSLDRLLAAWPEQTDLDGQVRRACQASSPAPLAAVRDVAGAIAAAAAGAPVPPSLEPLLAGWTAFADGITLSRLDQAFRTALPARPLADGGSTVRGAAEPAFDAEWMAPLAREMALVRMPVPLWQMERVTEAVRRYRCRTTAGRLAACTVHVHEGAVAEDGVPLARAAWIDAVGSGQYFIWRDEVYFTSRDGTDPRENGRQYTVLVPAFVAFLESQPGDDIRRRGL
jgi:hypothetical protein